MLEAALWAHIPPQPPTHIHTDAMVVVIVKGYKKEEKKTKNLNRSRREELIHLIICQARKLIEVNNRQFFPVYDYGIPVFKRTCSRRTLLKAGEIDVVWTQSLSPR